MFRIGQRVGCVCPFFHCPSCVVQPTLNAEYTIRGIRSLDGHEFLLLREIVNAPCSCANCKEETAFSAYGFKPLVADDVKNEHVIKLLNKHTEKKRTSAQLTVEQGYRCFVIAAHRGYVNQ